MCQDNGVPEMDEKNDNTLTPVIMGERNEILREYANHSFNSALAEVTSKIELEKDHEMKLGLLAAKSWILRKKLYVALHDPYISALSEVEDTDIFDGLDDEEYNEYDSLFDETPSEKTEKMVEILVLKKTTIDGKNIAKDTILDVSESVATSLIQEEKAKLNEPK